VRVPVYRGHSESVNLEFAAEITPEQARKILAKAPGVTVVDDPSKALYPLAINCDGRDDTFVGRIRRDDTIPHGLNMWIVSDNLRKGAALNAVQIAEKLIGS
jgi:aspartate-semialdehyde dehydrogenase